MTAKKGPASKPKVLQRKDKDVVLVFHPNSPKGEVAKTSEENREVLISEVVKGSGKVNGIFAGKDGRVIGRVPD